MDATTEALWRDRVRAFRASGQTARAFSRSNGFHETTLSKYVRRFGEATLSSTPLALARVRPGTGRGELIEPRPVPAAEGAIEVALAQGAVIRVRGHFDAELLRLVLRIVREGA